MKSRKTTSPTSIWKKISERSKLVNNKRTLSRRDSSPDEDSQNRVRVHNGHFVGRCGAFPERKVCIKFLLRLCQGLSWPLGLDAEGPRPRVSLLAGTARREWTAQSPDGRPLGQRQATPECRTHEWPAEIRLSKGRGRQ